LLPYSPALNPIQQFWSAVKREFIYSKKDAIPQIIADASNQVAQSYFEGLARYSVSLDATQFFLIVRQHFGKRCTFLYSP